MVKKIQKRVVIIGGGTGVASILSGLKNIPEIFPIAIVPASDEGGSTGKFIRAYRKAYRQRIVLGDSIEFVPVGDMANALISLSKLGPKVIKILNHRYSEWESVFKNHSLRNFIVQAAQELFGIEGIEELYDLLKIDGRVFPISSQFIPLVAILEDGSPLKELVIDDDQSESGRSVVIGEEAIDLLPYQEDATKKITGVQLVPLAQTKPVIYKLAQQAILNADLIVFAPSDIWGSLVPILLVKGVSEALEKSSAKKILFSPLMTKRLHTDGWSACDFAEIIEKHTQTSFIDTIFFNSAKIKPSDLKYYAKEGAYPVKLGNNCKTKIVKANLLDNRTVVQEAGDAVKRGIIRHDSRKIAELIRKYFDLD